jgi:hypothetical protein
MSELPPSQPPTPAEQRLLALLLLLRTPEEGGDRPLVASIMRRARVQRAVRELLGVLGGLTGAVGGVVRLLAGPRGDRP